MLNPSKKTEALNSPVERANKLNDPQFEASQGYFPYDLTHQEFITPRFGEITPTMHLDTVPADRTVVHDNTKLILNQINGNFLSNINQYVDSFYVPLRSVFPNNYEKLIPNPVKGEDLPNSALPVVPLYDLFTELYSSEGIIGVYEYEDNLGRVNIGNIYQGLLTAEDPVEYFDGLNTYEQQIYFGRFLLLCTILSRGQLMDYLGLAFDDRGISQYVSSGLQEKLDLFFYNFYSEITPSTVIKSYSLSLTENSFNFGGQYKLHSTETLSAERNSFADIFEDGRFPIIDGFDYAGMAQDMHDIILILDNLFITSFGKDFDFTNSMEKVDSAADPYADGHALNIGKILAYQQIVAQYYSNDHVDNIFTSELFMQNLRSVMFPSMQEDRVTHEPVFNINGVNYEYDYISYGGFHASLISDLFDGQLNRQYVWATIMLLLRRSLRYGDYFTTARPNMLAVSEQLGIDVENGEVSPIDITKNLLMQRYLNAANYIGQGFLQYMSSMYGVKPSDTGCIPRFISHRKIELQNQITNNTSDNQGKQTTNLVGYSDMSAFDVFIDDFGYLISLTSFDVLPIYKSGIDSTYHFSNRFDYFNPMLQNIGDQPIRTSELVGSPNLYDNTFGYTMRNGEYKYKISKAHGAFVNDLPGFMLSYPLNSYVAGNVGDLTIGPDIIRDKPAYLDSIVEQMTGVSPATYYHFICSCTNQVQCARKIQATPSVLF